MLAAGPAATDARATGNKHPDVPVLEVTLTAAGTKKMLAATSKPNPGRLAVLVDGEVIALPKVVTPIDGQFRISGDDRTGAFHRALETFTPPQ